MKGLILGHGKHGKGTVAALLQKQGFKVASSSEVAFPIIWPALHLATGIQTQQEAFYLRHQHRMLLKELISLLNTPDKSTLSRMILAEHDVYDGMRDPQEYEASRHLFDWVIYVDAGRRESCDPSMGIPYDPLCMWRIDNNGPIEALDAQVARFLDWLSSGGHDYLPVVRHETT